MRTPFLTLRAVAAIAGLAALASCEAANDPAALNQVPTGNLAAAWGQADVEEFELCKVGSSAIFDYTVHDRKTGNTTTVTGFSLNDGECQVIASYGDVGADVSVTETSAQSGYMFDRVDVTVVGVGAGSYSQTNPDVSEFISGTNGGGLRGALAVYYNVPEPPPLVDGRMTGGGKQIQVGVANITRGFTVHCDITLSNNIEINWEGYKWHLDKPIDTAQCFDDPAIIQDPPKAPLDKFVGTATGRLNGVDGSHLDFTFIDAGEPGRNDMAALKITAPDGTVVLDVPLSYLDKGNIQAHFDQPHK